MVSPCCHTNFPSLENKEIQIQIHASANLVFILFFFGCFAFSATTHNDENEYLYFFLFVVCIDRLLFCTGLLSNPSSHIWTADFLNSILGQLSKIVTAKVISVYKTFKCSFGSLTGQEPQLSMLLCVYVVNGIQEKC